MKTLFNLPKAKRRFMMHAVDMGCAPGMQPGWRTAMGARFTCAKCGHDDGWRFDMMVAEIRRGVPCPVCNPSNPDLGKPTA